MEIDATKSERIIVTIGDNDIKQIINDCNLPITSFTKKIKQMYIAKVNKINNTHYDYNEDKKEFGYWEDNYHNVAQSWDGIRKASNEDKKFFKYINNIEKTFEEE